MQFNPLKLFIMCRQEDVLTSEFTLLWQRLRERRHHARYSGGELESISKREVTHVGAFDLSLVPHQLRGTTSATAG
jgi:hypothetical protein